MSVQELRNKTAEELQKDLIELRKQQFRLRLQQGTGQLGQAHLLKLARREIARIKTVLNEQKRTAQG